MLNNKELLFKNSPPGTVFTAVQNGEECSFKVTRANPEDDWSYAKRDNSLNLCAIFAVRFDSRAGVFPNSKTGQLYSPNDFDLISLPQNTGPSRYLS